MCRDDSAIDRPLVTDLTKIKLYEDTNIALRGKSDNVAACLTKESACFFIHGDHFFEAAKEDVGA